MAQKPDSVKEKKTLSTETCVVAILNTFELVSSLLLSVWKTEQLPYRQYMVLTCNAPLFWLGRSHLLSPLPEASVCKYFFTFRVSFLMQIPLHIQHLLFHIPPWFLQRTVLGKVKCSCFIYHSANLGFSCSLESQLYCSANDPYVREGSNHYKLLLQFLLCRMIVWCPEWLTRSPQYKTTNLY